MIYSTIVQSKDGFDIPVFTNSKLMHSKYSPTKEASLFGKEISNNTNSTFTIILGLGGGYHIEEFAKQNPTHFILVIENSKDDILFLSKIECVKKLNQNINILIIPKEETLSSIINHYLPALHSGINILSNRPWVDSNENIAKEIYSTIKVAISEKTKDYSVQCHFGLIWQKNILNNLSILNNNHNKFDSTKFDTTKTAAIIAAGPSLDKSIEKLRIDRNKYFIIATDTAISILRKYNIDFDAAISIDGQNISHKHFIGLKNKFILKKSTPYFIFDLQSNFNAVKYVSNFSNNLIFIKSGHPFCNYAEILENKNINHFFNLDSGAGTVTITAIDFASKCGFSNIEVFGADFAYIFNKPYAKGTYLDTLYRIDENNLQSAENNFINLLYRTQITKTKFIVKNKIYSKVQNKVLDSYKQSFLEWIKNNNYKYVYNDFCYHISKKNENKSLQNFITTFDFNNFKNHLLNELNLITKNNKNPTSIKDLSNLEIALLPYIAFIRNKNKNLNYNECLKLAMSKILEYTK